MIKSEQAIVIEFETANPTTGAAADADSTPTGTLSVNGTDNAATVTVTKKATGSYKAAVTIPAGLTAGDSVALRINATVATVAGVKTVWSDFVDTKRFADLQDVSVANIWNALTSGMSAAGSIGKKLADWVVGNITAINGVAAAPAATPDVNVTTWKGATAPAMTGDAYARLGAPAGASVSADIAAAKAALDLKASQTSVDDLPTSSELTAALAAADDAVLAAVAEVKAETANILADTNELQTDLANGGRLDMIFDAIKTAADTAAAAAVGAGAGAITWPYTLTKSTDGSPIAGASVWVTTDAAGTNVIASGTTNASGVVTFYLDAGTVYIWRSLAGYNFTNPDTEVVSAS